MRCQEEFGFRACGSEPGILHPPWTMFDHVAICRGRTDASGRLCSSGYCDPQPYGFLRFFEFQLRSRRRESNKALSTYLFHDTLRIRALKQIGF